MGPGQTGMKIYRGDAQPPFERGAVVTIGTFDGVHRGHRAVLDSLLQAARARKAPAGVLTFGQHPRKVLDGRGPDLLTTLEHRLLLFERAGVDFAWVLDFTPELSKLTAERFAETYFAGKLNIAVLVLGFDSRFGCDRMGVDSKELKPLGERLGFGVECLAPVQSADGEPVSSTLIRDAIWEGRLRDAEAMLGRRISVLGNVVKGDARGRRLGYATANLDLDRQVRPPFGVYATLAEVGGKTFHSITNVGYRPTVAPSKVGERPDLLIETHLFDYAGDLYGQRMEVHFVEKLRDERRFPDIEALVEQIRKDEARARATLKGVEVEKS